MSSRVKNAVARYWWPFFLALGVIWFLVQLYRLPPDRQTLGYLFSGPIHQTFDLLCLVLLLAPTARNRWGQWLGWTGLDVCLVTFIASQGLKLAIRAPRPAPSHSHSGFPSGHILFDIALSWAIASRYPRMAPVCFGITAAVGWSRMDTHAHYPYQVIWGAIIGTIIGLISGFTPKGIVFPRLLRRKEALAAK